MAKAFIPHFHNDSGVPQVVIGVTEFMCIGANAPFDHPHIYLDMGDDGEKVCPYCSTLYKFDENLSPTQTKPEGHLVDGDLTEAGIGAGAAPIEAVAVTS